MGLIEKVFREIALNLVVAFTVRHVVNEANTWLIGGKLAIQCAGGAVVDVA